MIAGGEGAWRRLADAATGGRAARVLARKGGAACVRPREGREGRREEVVDTRTGTIYGCPFVARGASEAGVVADAYADLISSGATVHAVARRWATERGGLRVHVASSSTRPEARRAALERLACVLHAGGMVRVRCACGPGEKCHADVIRAWIEHRAARMCSV